MKVTGTAWKFPQNDVSTDQIRSTAYSHLPLNEQAQHCLETLDSSFASKVRPGDFVVGGQNFGCGSARPAHLALRALGIGGVMAESFGRLFFRRSIGDGFLVAPCPGIIDFVSSGDRIEIDVDAGQVRNLTTDKSLALLPLAPFLRDMIECGGEIPYLKARLARERAA